MCLTPLTKWLANHTLGVWITIGVIFVLLITVLIATGLINPYYVLLLPIPIGISLVYSLAKRYTWICHILLAMTNASVPVASWIVFYDWKDWRGMILGASVFFWTLGFELIYSSQDVFYDIQMGMKSIPVVFGIKKTYQISIFCHVIMSVLLVLFSYIMNVGVIFWIGLFAGIMLIVKEHILISGNRVENAKYTFDLNQMFSCILMIFSMLDFLLQYSRETGL
jgi:4-hydroxybenzoate polyprenyltransferase